MVLLCKCLSDRSRESLDFGTVSRRLSFGFFKVPRGAFNAKNFGELIGVICHISKFLLLLLLKYVVETD